MRSLVGYQHGTGILVSSNQDIICHCTSKTHVCEMSKTFSFLQPVNCSPCFCMSLKDLSFTFFAVLPSWEIAGLKTKWLSLGNTFSVWYTLFTSYFVPKLSSMQYFFEKKQNNLWILWTQRSVSMVTGWMSGALWCPEYSAVLSLGWCPIVSYHSKRSAATGFRMFQDLMSTLG